MRHCRGGRSNPGVTVDSLTLLCCGRCRRLTVVSETKGRVGLLAPPTVSTATAPRSARSDRSLRPIACVGASSLWWRRIRRDRRIQESGKAMWGCGCDLRPWQGAIGNRVERGRAWGPHPALLAWHLGPPAPVSSPFLLWDSPSPCDSPLLL